jgi:hypothetical protein
MRVTGRAHELIEQEEIGDDEAMRFVDDAHHLIEDALFESRLPEPVRVGEVVQEGNVGWLDADRSAGNVRAGRHRFDRVPSTDGHPPRDEQREEEVLAETAPTGRSFF